MFDYNLLGLGFLLPICVASALGSDKVFPIHAISKTLSSVFFLLIGWYAGAEGDIIQWYFKFVMIGLIFGFFGDIFLLSDKHHFFQVGVLVFLTGHIFYIIAFYYLCLEYSDVSLFSSPHSYMVPVGIIIFSSLIYAWLRPHISKMKVEVIAYILVISVMVILAYFTFATTKLNIHGRILVLVGSFLFFFSDVFVAIEKFIDPNKKYRLSLFLYYGGQVCIAYSIGSLHHIRTVD